MVLRARKRQKIASDHPVLRSPRGETRPARQTELAQCVGDVILDGPLRQEEASRDVGVRCACGDQHRHLLLAR